MKQHRRFIRKPATSLGMEREERRSLIRSVLDGNGMTPKCSWFLSEGTNLNSGGIKLVQYRLSRDPLYFRYKCGPSIRLRNYTLLLLDFDHCSLTQLSFLNYSHYV